MSTPVLILGGGPLDGLVAVAKGPDDALPATVVGEAWPIEQAERPAILRVGRPRRVCYTLRRIAVPRDRVALVDGHRVYDRQVVYVLDGYEPRFETLTWSVWESRERVSGR